LRLRKQDFVQAAIAQGLAPPGRSSSATCSPNGIAPVLVGASFGRRLGDSLLKPFSASLALGLVDETSWGPAIESSPPAPPAEKFLLVACPLPRADDFFLTVYAYNLVGESLRDALDPKLRGR